LDKSKSFYKSNRPIKHAEIIKSKLLKHFKEDKPATIAAQEEGMDEITPRNISELVKKMQTID